jgi:hypothetical protein
MRVRQLLGKNEDEFMFSASFASTNRTDPLVVKHSVVGYIPFLQGPLLNLSPLRSPRPRFYWFVM